MSRKQKKRLRSSSFNLIEKESKNLPKKRKIKVPEEFLRYQQELKKTSNKPLGGHFWHRSQHGNYFSVAQDLLCLDKKKFDADEVELIKNMRNSTDFYAKNCDFDSPPQVKTPKKAITRTPRKREFINILKINIKKYHHEKLTKNIRLLIFQEEISKNPAINLTFKNIKDSEKIKKLQKRLAQFQNHDGSKIQARRVINKGQLTRARKARRSRYVKNHVSAKEIGKNYLEGLSQPLELSHLVPVSQGGPKDCALPTTKGHNSKRIPIEILSPFFVQFGLSVEFETVDHLLKNQYGFIPMPHSEEISLNIPKIGILLTFFLNPLCPREPVKGLYDVVQKVGLYSLSGTAFFEAGQEIIKRKQEKKSARERRSHLNR